jgi:hypothetical protein
LAIFTVYINAPYATLAYDDAFISYRYAYNLATGHGMVYNIGEHYLGTSAPLWTLLLGLVCYHHPVWIPHVGGWLTILSVAATGVMLVLIGHATGQRMTGWVAAILWSLFGALHFMMGCEIFLQIALVLATALSLLHNRRIAAGVLIGLNICVRPDAAIPSLILLALVALKRRQVPKTETVIAGALVTAMLITCTVYYGSAIPSTLGAKLAQYSASGSFVGDLIPMTAAYISAAFPWVRWTAAGAMILISFVVQLRKPSAFMAITIALAAQCLAFVAAKMPFYLWYYLPTIMVVTIATGNCAELVGLLAPDKRVRCAIWSFILGALLWNWQPFNFLTTAQFTTTNESQYSVYKEAGQWLNANTQKSASVGYMEIGVLGWYSHRPIIDLLGLVNPGISPHVRTHDYAFAYKTYMPDFIILSPQFTRLTDCFAYSDWFRRDYKYVRAFSHSGSATISLFRRQTGPRIT